MYLTLAFFAAAIMPLTKMAPRIRQQAPPYRVVLEGLIAGVVGAIFIFILASVSDRGVYAEMQESIQYLAKNLANNQNLAKAMQLEAQTPAQRIAIFTKLYQTAADLMPAAIGIFSTAAAYLGYILLSKLPLSKKKAAIPMPPFRQFSLPNNALLGWISIYLLSWLLTLGKLLPNDLVYTNINALFTFVFALQGMSVLFHFCHIKRAPKITAIILIIFLLITAFGQTALFVLGIVDMILKLKERMRDPSL